MRKRALSMAVSIGAMSVALLLTLTNQTATNTAKASDTPEVPVSTTQSVETTSQSPVTTTDVVTPTQTTSSAPESVEVPVTTTSIKQEDEPGWDCTLDGDRVCGVPDEAGKLHLVCHNINGMPVRIVSDVRNCK